jgi:hypothetical protein
LGVALLGRRKIREKLRRFREFIVSDNLVFLRYRFFC